MLLTLAGVDQIDLGRPSGSDQGLGGRGQHHGFNLAAHYGLHAQLFGGLGALDHADGLARGESEGGQHGCRRREDVARQVDLDILGLFHRVVKLNDEDALAGLAAVDIERHRVAIAGLGGEARGLERATLAVGQRGGDIERHLARTDIELLGPRLVIRQILAAL